jgi:hypothetical protein
MERGPYRPLNLFADNTLPVMKPTKEVKNEGTTEEVLGRP